MRIGRQAVAGRFLTELVHLLFADSSFEEGARINPGGGVALEIHQIAAMRVGLAVEEMIECDVVQGRSGRKAGDMAAQFGRIAIGIQYQCHRVPAHQRAYAVLKFTVAG